MRALEETGGIRYGLLDAEDVTEMIHVVADAFGKHDPPAMALGLTAADIERIVGLLAPKALAEDLTIIARSEDGDIVGAMLTEDFGLPPADLAGAPAAFEPFGVILERLEEEYRRTNPVEPGNDLHLFMVAVSDGSTGRGIAQRMVELCVDNGTRRGYRSAFAETTSRTSQHIFRKAGFQERARISYRDFVYEGSRVFAGIGDEGATLLMVRSLT